MGEQKTLSQLQSHCSSHFLKELGEEHKDLMNGLRCQLCGQVFRSKYLLTVHLGCKHGKVNEALRKKGYKVLPCPISASNNADIQKNMLLLKKGLMEIILYNLAGKLE